VRKARKKLEDALQQSLEAQTLRATRGVEARAEALERWQKGRLARSYADFSADSLHHAATSFFTDELYASPDLGARDEEIARMVPFMVKLLPAGAVETMANAVFLQAMTLDLDLAVTCALPESVQEILAMSWGCYSSAYRSVGRRKDRQRQIEMIIEVGKDLDRLVTNPLIVGALRLCRMPAKLAGLMELHQFLDHGFSAFRQMSGADTFLAAIAAREKYVLEALFDDRDISIDAVDLPNKFQPSNMLSS
jgi:hypothetical protein